MTVVAQTDPDFAFAGLDTPELPPEVAHAAAQPAGGPADPLGPLGALQ